MLINKPGFNLLELLLSITMVALMAGIIAPVAGNLYNRNNHDLAVKEVVQDFRRARTLARAAEGDSDWGVYLAGNQSTIFKGSGYSSRDSYFDEVSDLPGQTIVGGLTEVVFSKATGWPQVTGTTSVSIGVEIKYININGQGIINY